MNQHETQAEKFERQQEAVADLRLEQEVDEQTQIAVIEEAARRATRDIWPDMPEDERKRVVESVVGFEALAFQLAIFRRGWSSGPNAQRIQLDPETAGARILVRAYATAEADSLRMRTEAKGQSPEDDDRPSLEDRLRRYLRPWELENRD